MIREIDESNIILDELLDCNDWGKICSNYEFNEELIERYKNKINWIMLSMYQNLNEEIIEKYENNVNWFFISIYQKLTGKFILKYKEKVNWKCISQYQELTLDFIIKNKNNIYLSELLENTKISKKIKIEIISRRILTW